MSFSPLLVQLIDALRCMPGVGKKSAQRIAFHLLERDREGASSLSAALSEAVEGIGHCKRCRMLSEHEVCSICAASGRDDTQLCVVESPADVMAIEDATGFRGRYFVLMGHLSPLDGIGPQELGLTTLEQRLADPGLYHEDQKDALKTMLAEKARLVAAVSQAEAAWLEAAAALESAAAE